MYMMYIHDENGAVNGICLWYPGNTEWTYYYFVKNLQGDVLEVYNEDHSCVASYTYDSWGNILSKSGSLADINPFRYRGYYFDNESWFYYLQSRYYDPSIGRFINADILTSTGQGILGNNMFAYCNNNPINYSDYTGALSIGAFLGAVVGGAVAGSIISTVSYVVSCGLNNQSVTRAGLIDAAKSGAISGAVGGAIGTISVGSQIVSTAQKIIPGATSKILTISAKALASIGAGIVLSNGQAQQEIITSSAIASTFLGSLIDATTDSFAGTAFCNYAATLFVGTVVEVITVAIKEMQPSSRQPQIPHQASRAIANLGLAE